MKMKNWKRIGQLAGIGAIAGCLCLASARQTPDDGGPIRQRNQGYSLLYQLLSDESGVSKILILKHADEPVAGLVKEIASACKAAKKQMDDFHKADASTEFDVPDLPRVEQESRDLDSSIEEKELLFSSGKTFELRLIYSQAQAVEYGEVLCNALAVRGRRRAQGVCEESVEAVRGLSGPAVGIAGGEAVRREQRALMTRAMIVVLSTAAMCRLAKAEGKASAAEEKYALHEHLHVGEKESASVHFDCKTNSIATTNGKPTATNTETGMNWKMTLTVLEQKDGSALRARAEIDADSFDTLKDGGGPEKRCPRRSRARASFWPGTRTSRSPMIFRRCQ